MEKMSSALFYYLKQDQRQSSSLFRHLGANINLTLSLDDSPLCIPFLDVVINSCKENIITDM